MMSPMMMVFALQLLRVFQSFETEYLLGMPFGFFVYSTKIFTLIRNQIPNYGEATVLASITLLMIALIIPLQRWILERRRYTTITGSFRPGLIDLGKWNYIAFAVIASALRTAYASDRWRFSCSAASCSASATSCLGFTLDHWRLVLTDPVFVKALRTTLTLALTAAILSPLIFSVIAYILVRTRLPGRGALDLMIWSAGAIPGILAGLGLLWVFIGTPGLNALFGTIWALIIVVILQGKTTGVNIMKGVLVQVGADMEEAARVSGAGWIRTYFQNLAAALHADPGAAGGDELRQRRRRHQQHHLARFARHHDAVVNGAGALLHRSQQSRSREHHQHLHHRLHRHRRALGALLRPPLRRAPRHACRTKARHKQPRGFPINSGRLRLDRGGPAVPALN